MNTRYWFIPLVVGFVVIAALMFRPVPIPEEKDCLTAKGMVVDIYEAGEKDVVVQLEGQQRIFYVNRGLERGLELQKLRAGLVNKVVTIKYPQYWTPLDPGNSIRHISKIESDGKTVFSEID